VTSVHARRALLGGTEVDGLRLEVDGAGRIASVALGAAAREGDLRLDTVLYGSGNAHSHAFHRALRGRTHGQGGDFWRWRTLMYDVAVRLEPDSYELLAEAVFAEMLVSGWTAVAEFHYVHHRVGGGRYQDPNAFGSALVRAATRVGIRLTLLDTCYLTGGPGRPLAPEQSRFGDGTVQAWLERRQALETLASDTITVGAALHSVRAVAPDDIAAVAAALPGEVPLHLHLSEQPAENEQSLAAYGRTPTGVLADAGVLAPRLSVVHATHLTDEDIAALGGAGVTAVFCPTTEADLGDGIGPARELADAGAVLALGSDQNAVVDPWLEVRGLESGERLRSGRRGRLTPGELEQARTAGGYRALGSPGGFVVGAPADLVELDTAGVRTTGSLLPEIGLTATGTDVLRTIVGGRIVAEAGRLVDGRDPAGLLRRALTGLTAPPTAALAEGAR
jgi:formiminoglutamate deiminase